MRYVTPKLEGALRPRAECNMYRLYTEVQVSTLFTQPRAEGPRLCKSRRDRTEVYNGLVPWAMWPP